MLSEGRAEVKKPTYKVNDMIDALKLDILHRRICWSQASILEIKEDTAHIGFLYDITDRFSL